MACAACSFEHRGVSEIPFSLRCPSEVATRYVVGHSGCFGQRALLARPKRLDVSETWGRGLFLVDSHNVLTWYPPLNDSLVMEGMRMVNGTYAEGNPSVSAARVTAASGSS